MVTILLGIILGLALPEVTVEIPDTVAVGESFQCNITVDGTEFSNLHCVPAYSRGLDYIGSISSTSFRSVMTPGGRVMTGTTSITLTFVAGFPGTFTVGPLSLMAGENVIYTSPEFTVTATGSPGSAPDAGNRPGGRHRHGEERALAWFEIVPDTSQNIFPGMTFEVDYYLCSPLRNVELRDFNIIPSGYANSNIKEQTHQLAYRNKDGIYKNRLFTLEVTPAFPCTLTVPLLKGWAAVPDPFFPFGSPKEFYVDCDTVRVCIHPFPEDDKPSNFDGVIGEVRFSINEIKKGYSHSGERCIVITASGTGYPFLEKLPDLTVTGPADLLQHLPPKEEGERRTWTVFVEPTDSGTVIVGPDSIAWFDPVTLEYHQSVIPACTLSVYPPNADHVEIYGDENDGNSTHLILLIISGVLLVAAFILFTTRNRNMVNESPEPWEAVDIEELLTAFEERLSTMLMGSRTPLGPDLLDEALDRREVDPLLSRRILRLWKDLELELSGGHTSEKHLEKLKKKTLELLTELERELRRD